MYTSASEHDEIAAGHASTSAPVSRRRDVSPSAQTGAARDREHVARTRTRRCASKRACHAEAEVEDALAQRFGGRCAAKATATSPALEHLRDALGVRHTTQA